jgi:hypothetical protein
MREHAKTKTVGASSIITDQRSVLMGIQIGMDSANDPTITVYDGTDANGEVLIPTGVYDASVLGLPRVSFSYDKRAYNGIYVDITCGGTVEVTVDYREGV